MRYETYDINWVADTIKKQRVKQRTKKQEADALCDTETIVEPQVDKRIWELRCSTRRRVLNMTYGTLGKEVEDTIKSEGGEKEQDMRRRQGGKTETCD